MSQMFALAKNYTYSFKTWKLNPECDADLFLDRSYQWHLINTENDLPMKNGKRICPKETGEHKIWKVL
jgi:hypothetical protein